MTRHEALEYAVSQIKRMAKIHEWSTDEEIEHLRNSVGGYCGQNEAYCYHKTGFTVGSSSSFGVDYEKGAWLVTWKALQDAINSNQKEFNFTACNPGGGLVI